MLILADEKEIFVELSNPATRLLVMFIKNNKVNLSRDDLLKNVWEDYGFTSSYSLLSNHVSELRKAFTSIGLITDVIITVPRIGFKLDIDVVLHSQPAQPPQDTSTPAMALTENGKKEVIDNIEKNRKMRFFNKWKLRKGFVFKKHIPDIFFYLSILAIIVSYFSNSIYQSNNFEKADISFAFSYKNCDIYQVDELKEVNSTYIIEQIKRNSIYCLKNKTDIFYTKSHSSNESFNVSLITACTKDSNKNYNTCTNFLLNPGG